MHIILIDLYPKNIRHIDSKINIKNIVFGNFSFKILLCNKLGINDIVIPVNIIDTISIYYFPF